MLKLVLPPGMLALAGKVDSEQWTVNSPSTNHRPPSTIHAPQEPRELEFGSGEFSDTSVNGRGHAGEVLSHARQALNELLQEHRPAAVTFTAVKPSRQKAYEHLLRRFNASPEIHGGEYEALWEPVDRALAIGPAAEPGQAVHDRTQERAALAVVSRRAADRCRAAWGVERGA